jgi:hypothetical protein
VRSRTSEPHAPCFYSKVVCPSALYSSHDWSIQLIPANGGNHRAGHADIRNGPASGSGNCNQKAGWRRRWPFFVMDLPEGLSSGPALAREYSPRASNSPSKLRRNGQLRQAPSGPRSPASLSADGKRTALCLSTNPQAQSKIMRDRRPARKVVTKWGA